MKVYKSSNYMAYILLNREFEALKLGKKYYELNSHKQYHLLCIKTERCF
jgi:hypothetical protein